MSLVKCPECGREKVSDTASACPDCGFDVKSYYEKIAQDKRRREEIERRQQQKKVQQESEAKKKAEREKEVFNSVKMPDPPSFPFFGLVTALFCGFAGYSFLKWHMQYNIDGQLDAAIIFFILAAFIPFVSLGYYYIRRCEYKDLCENAEKFEKYKEEKAKKILDDEEKAKIARNERIKTEQIKMSTNPVCPNCGSRNTRKITTANRAVSVAAVGLASSKIGKQYECKNCKHKW